MQMAALWYNKQKNGLGNVFLSRIKERVRKLKSNPYACQVRYKNVHVALVPVPAEISPAEASGEPAL